MTYKGTLRISKAEFKEMQFKRIHLAIHYCTQLSNNAQVLLSWTRYERETGMDSYQSGSNSKYGSGAPNFLFEVSGSFSHSHTWSPAGRDWRVVKKRVGSIRKRAGVMGRGIQRFTAGLRGIWDPDWLSRNQRRPNNNRLSERRTEGEHDHVNRPPRLKLVDAVYGPSAKDGLSGRAAPRGAWECHRTVRLRSSDERHSRTESMAAA